MTKFSLADLQDRLSEPDDSQRAGGGQVAALVCRCDIRPLLPPSAAEPVVDFGDGRDESVRLLQADGFDAGGIDTSSVRAAYVRAEGMAWVRQGDLRTTRAADSTHYAAITATDLFGYRSKPGVLQTKPAEA